MISYVDASAFLKRYVEEPGSEWVDQLFASAWVATCALSRAEVVAALHKAVRQSWLGNRQALEARERFTAEWRFFARLPISEALIDRATVMSWNHGLRGYDSMHLAAASVWRDALGEAVSFATFDRRLWEAAAAEQFEAYPPNLPDLLATWRE